MLWLFCCLLTPGAAPTVLLSISGGAPLIPSVVSCALLLLGLPCAEPHPAPFEHHPVVGTGQAGLEITTSRKAVTAGCAPQGRWVEQLLESLFPVYLLPEVLMVW